MQGFELCQGMTFFFVWLVKMIRESGDTSLLASKGNFECHAQNGDDWFRWGGAFSWIKGPYFKLLNFFFDTQLPALLAKGPTQSFFHDLEHMPSLG